MGKKIPVLSFVLLVSSLLIGQRYGAVWAGGVRIIQTESVEVVQMFGQATVDRAGKTKTIQSGDHLIRGETIKTGDVAHVLLQTPSGIVFALDERSEVTLDQLIVDKDFSLRLIKGRIIMNGNERTPITIKTNRTTSAFTEGGISLVNYDFLETVGIPLRFTATRLRSKDFTTGLS